MKTLKYFITTFFSLFIGVAVVQAAPTYSFYTSASSITVGSSVTATIQLKNAASWNIHLTGNGATSGCSETYADATENAGNTTKYFSVTCYATSTGQIGFTVTGDVTSADGSIISISDARSVVVQPPREKDTNNYLKSLGVTGYTLSPEFNREVMEYSVKVPSTVNYVSLTAELESIYATLNGTGDFEVNEGLNAFEIKVVSETGVERVYTVKVEVEDENPIEIAIEDHQYTIMKNAKTLEIPATYEPKTIQINGFDIPAFFSEVSQFTLIGVKDSKGTTHFAIYHEKENRYELYNENKSSQLLLFIQPILEEKEGFSKKTIVIQEKSYEALVSDADESIVLVNAMNIMDGSTNYYYYNLEDNTFLKYNDSVVSMFQEELKKYQVVIFAFAGVLIFFLFMIVILLCYRPKRKKKENLQKEVIQVNKMETKEEKSTPIKKEEKETKKQRKERLKKEKLEKKLENKKNVEKTNEEPKDEKKEELKKEPLKEEKKRKKNSKEDAIKKVSDAAKIIEEYEKTIQLNKKDLEKRKKELKMEETMYDLFEDEHKKKRR